LDHKIELSEELKESDTVEILAETNTEQQEIVLAKIAILFEEQQIKFEEVLGQTIGKMSRENAKGRRKAEIYAWIRTILVAIVSFTLGKFTPSVWY